MKRVIIVLSAVIAMFTSCATTQVVKTTSHTEASARLLEPEQAMFVTPVIADLKVSDTKVYYTEKEAFANLVVTQELLNKDLPEMKRIALSRAARAHNADVLVGSTIDIETKNNRLEITVSGYPACYVKFRNANEDDVNLLTKASVLHTKDGASIVEGSDSSLKVEETKVR